jgi:deoxyhypusine synthase
LLVINALGDAVPQKIIDWIVTTVEGSDGDILRVRAFALAACDVRAEDTRVSPSEAVATIREICARRLNS